MVVMGAFHFDCLERTSAPYSKELHRSMFLRPHYEAQVLPIELHTWETSLFGGLLGQCEQKLHQQECEEIQCFMA